MRFLKKILYPIFLFVLALCPSSSGLFANGEPQQYKYIVTATAAMYASPKDNSTVKWRLKEGTVVYAVKRNGAFIQDTSTELWIRLDKIKAWPSPGAQKKVKNFIGSYATLSAKDRAFLKDKSDAVKENYLKSFTKIKYLILNEEQLFFCPAPTMEKYHEILTIADVVLSKNGITFLGYGEDVFPRIKKVYTTAYWIGKGLSAEDPRVYYGDDKVLNKRTIKMKVRGSLLVYRGMHFYKVFNHAL